MTESCRVAAEEGAAFDAVDRELSRCTTPASRHHNGTIWVSYKAFPVWLQPDKTWRLALDNHRVRSVDLWLVAADGRRARYQYNPRSPDREWGAGNYLSILLTPRFEVDRLVVRLGDSESYGFVRPSQIARAKDFASAERNQAAFYGIGVGMLALTILFHLSLFFAIRRRFQLIYCAHVCLLFAYALCYSGIIRLVAPGLTSSGVSNLLGFTMVAATGTGIAFIVQFLGSPIPKWLRRWARIASLASLIAAVLMVTAPVVISYGAFIVANVVAMHAIFLTTVILAFACWRRIPLAGLVALGWVMPIVVSLLYPLRTMGLLPAEVLPDGLMLIASTVECLILSLPVASRIRNLRIAHERAEERHAVLERQAQTDALTGLANRRGFGEALTRSAAAHAQAAQISLLVIDIDHFKRVNDRHGHAAGDLILQHVATLVAKVAGGGAIVSRFGGEEFVVALRGYDLARAGTIAERIRIAIAAMLGPALPRITVSIGVAEGLSDAINEVLADADSALYRAKNEGRDRVVVADGPLMYAAA